MSSSQQIHLHSQSGKCVRFQTRTLASMNHLLRALNKIRKPSTAEEITELLNRDLDPGERPFQTREIATWLQNASDQVLRLYWLETRPRR
jgi:hypothetical protein